MLGDVRDLIVVEESPQVPVAEVAVATSIVGPVGELPFSDDESAV